MKKNILIITLALLLNLGLLFIPDLAMAAVESTLKQETFDVNEYLKLPGNEQRMEYFVEDDNYSPIVRFALRIIDFATKVIGSIAIILIIVAGFVYMFAQGDQQQLDKAKDILKFAIIGVLVTFFSYVITLFIQSIFSKA